MEVMNQMKLIKYGWMDKKGNIHKNDYEDFAANYILQSPKEVLKNKIGVCWDQVELERYLFTKEKIKVKTYFIIYQEGEFPTHTFLTYEKNGKFYWFEHAWEMFSGIHEYPSEEELLYDVRNKYIENELNDDFINEKLKIYEYKKPNYHISCQEFCDYCSEGNLKY